MTPTQRTLKLLDELGYKPGIVERWVPNPAYPGGGKRIDLWGIIDIIAINNRETVAVQSTGTNTGEQTPMIEHHAKHAVSPTRKTAINAKCCECMGWEPGKEPPPSISTFIRDCSAKSCPLYVYRPYR